PLTVTLLIGVGDFDASSLVGTVSIDSSTPVNVNVSSGADLLRAKSAAAQEFGLHGAQAATASKYGCIQLINPAASGVTVAVNSIIVSCNVAGIAASLHQYNTALANTSTQQGRNKLNGGADALAELNYEALSAFLSLTYISYKVVNGVYMPMQMIETSPLILGEGEGCLVACNSVNQFITADFEWSEY
ncbi:MAG: hypothetical protein OEW37_07765, partial [Rhodospirillaceae bacterium]|nr:hypothetical protein [Rhodospirillaceae bacterium]